ncbi:hypothetical protein [Kitasatospora kifunensis]|uniref:Uncharacterized protein n=1 Tax=Kitasatospora kifunensis TaxID=58351 RepID=A0A7W7R2N3_KITKI|nr:hypothetical protein [Kitasatospora kifunensis]MBB4924295.1 hypothetical protein [Kitasatospora kifunensis]
MADTRLRSLFSEAELAQLAAHRVPFAVGDERDAAELAGAWAAQVARIDADRALPPFDRTAWNAYDLAGALFLRDHLATALAKLPSDLRERLEQAIVQEVDDHYRSFTVVDDGRRMEQIAQLELVGRGWWWFRVPANGPIADDLLRHEICAFWHLSIRQAR